jgi:site-specific DNA-methyltransferase (adenine-specific)
MSLLKKVPNESVDIIIADPPYNIGKNFGNNFDTLDIEAYVSWCKDWIDECFRVLKESGTMYIYGFSETLAHISVGITNQKRWLIWHYTNKNVASLNFWQRSHEAIICTWKTEPFFNRDNVREPYTESFLNGAAGKKRKDTVGRFSKGGNETFYKAHEKGALPRDVLKIPALAGGAGRIERWIICNTCDTAVPPENKSDHEDHDTEKHPTQKPFELTRRLIMACKNDVGGTVLLVPFSGTGSECVVAKELGIDFLAFEINPKYVKLGNAMLATVQPKLF